MGSASELGSKKERWGLERFTFELEVLADLGTTAELLVYAAADGIWHNDDRSGSCHDFPDQRTLLVDPADLPARGCPACSWRHTPMVTADGRWVNLDALVVHLRALRRVPDALAMPLDTLDACHALLGKLAGLRGRRGSGNGMDLARTRIRQALQGPLHSLLVQRLSLLATEPIRTEARALEEMGLTDEAQVMDLLATRMLKRMHGPDMVLSANLRFDSRELLDNLASSWQVSDTLVLVPICVHAYQCRQNPASFDHLFGPFGPGEVEAIAAMYDPRGDGACTTLEATRQTVRALDS